MPKAKTKNVWPSRVSPRAIKRLGLSEWVGLLFSALFLLVQTVLVITLSAGAVVLLLGGIHYWKIGAILAAISVALLTVTIYFWRDLIGGYWRSEHPAQFVTVVALDGSEIGSTATRSSARPSHWWTDTATREEIGQITRK